MSINRLNDEQAFHDSRFGGKDIRDKIGKYYAANKHLDDRYLELVASLCKGKQLLEYGCGSGSGSNNFLDFGAEVTGIDISPEGIKAAREAAAKTGYKAEYFVMNAENMDFEDNRFDIIVGTAIVHHLDLSSSYNELRRVLRNDGHLVLVEPMGHNPFINLYRTLTPNMRTRDEHPLLMKDIELLKEYFDYVVVDYYSLFTLMAVPFRKTPFFERFSNFLRGVDKIVFRIALLQKLAWFTLIHASHPKK